MPLHRFRSALLLLSVLACDSTAPDGPGTAVRWRTPPIPSGGATILVINRGVDFVSGRGEDLGLMGRPTATFSIAGPVHETSPLRLTLTYSPHSIATFDVDTVSATRLVGLWQAGTQAPYRREFLRE